MSQYQHGKTSNKLTAKLRSWWQKNKQPLIIMGIIFVALLLIVTLAVLRFGWDWTGFSSETGPTLKPNEQYRSGKTLWDVLQLLIVPIILAIGGFWLNQIQKSREERAIKQRTENERKIAIDNQRASVLQIYIDKMSELILEKHLCEAKPEDEIRKVARIRTLVTLVQLDKVRRGTLIIFLHDSGLITRKDRGAVDIDGDNIEQAFLRRARLRKAYMPETELRGIILTETNLYKANFEHTDLRDAIFYRAVLENANLRNADLTSAVLSEANLYNAWLIGANLSNANLFSVRLENADLTNANLTNVLLSEAKVSQVNLEGANLKGAKGIMIEELEKQAASLKGTTMPDGSIHP